MPVRNRPGSVRVTVPRLVGLPAPQALERLRRAELSGATRGVFSEKPRDQVVGQLPGAAGKLAAGETVTLYVSKGPKVVPVPDVAGQTVADALSTLRAQGFRTRIVRVPNAEPAGHVVAQHPGAGTRARTSAAVRLNVSDGRQSGRTASPSPPPRAAHPKPGHLPPASAAMRQSAVYVPDLAGQKLKDARKLLHRIGLIVEIRRVPSSQPSGTIVAQAKKPGTTVRQGTHLLMTVSTGNRPATSSVPRSSPQPILVPDVTGEDEKSATEDLRSAGLKARIVDQDTTDASQDGLVIEQTPAANEPMQPNSTVTISIGRYTG